VRIIRATAVEAASSARRANRWDAKAVLGELVLLLLVVHGALLIVLPVLVLGGIIVAVVDDVVVVGIFLPP